MRPPPVRFQYPRTSANPSSPRAVIGSRPAAASVPAQRAHCPSAQRRKTFHQQLPSGVHSAPSATTTSATPSPSRSWSARRSVGRAPTTPSRAGSAQAPTSTVGGGRSTTRTGGRARPAQAASSAAITQAATRLEDIAGIGAGRRPQLGSEIVVAGPAERGVGATLGVLDAGLVVRVDAVERTGEGGRRLEEHQQLAERLGADPTQAQA